MPICHYYQQKLCVCDAWVWVAPTKQYGSLVGQARSYCHGGGCDA